MEIRTEIEVLPQPPKEERRYYVGEKKFTSYERAEKYLMEQLKEELFHEIPHNTSITLEGIKHWYFCETFNHLLAVIETYSYLILNIDQSRDINFPQWISLNEHEAKIDTLSELKSEVRMKLKTIETLERMIIKCK